MYQPALKPAAEALQTKLASPCLPVLLEQCGLAAPEVTPRRVVLVRSCQYTLQADQLGSWVALLFEPVGEDQPRPVVVGLLLDRPQKGEHFGTVGDRRGGHGYDTRGNNERQRRPLWAGEPHRARA